jgi:hypothetical protein
MKAVYTASPRSKKGNVFHIYNVVGTAQEIEEYKNSPNFKQYPAIGPKGEIQFITNYISMEDEVNMILKKDGNFTLDTGTFNKDIARLNAMSEASAVLADKLSNGSAVAAKRTVAVQFADEPVDDNLDGM